MTIGSTRRRNVVLGLLLLAGAAGCTPSNIVGPLSHVDEERDILLTRARAAGVSEETINKFIPPQTPEEAARGRAQDSSCRTSYMWKNALTWTGSILIAVAAGFTIGGAYLSGKNNTLTENTSNTGQIAFGVSAGTLATLGSGLVAVGGIIANGFTDRGCQSKIVGRSGN